MEKHTVTLEGSKLKEIANSNDTSLAIFMALANRGRFRTHTDISHMKNTMIRHGEKIILEDYMKTFKELQSLGIGTVIIGRNGAPTRFKWNYSLKSVGQAGMNGEDVQVTELKREPLKQPELKKKSIRSIKRVSRDPKEVRAIPSTNNVLYIPLRKDFVIDMQIPADVTKQELDTIHTALKRFG